MFKGVKWAGGFTAGIILITLLFLSLPKEPLANAGVDNGYYGKKAKYVFFFI